MKKIILLLLVLSFNSCKPAEERIYEYSYAYDWYNYNNQRYQVYLTKNHTKYILILNKEETKYINE